MSTIVGGNLIAAITGGVYFLQAGVDPTVVDNVTPAVVMREYIVTVLAEMSMPSLSDIWPLYVSHLPDGENVDDQAGAVYDTSAAKDGRLMEGPVVLHEGVELVVRSPSYSQGWSKIKDITDALDLVNNVSITVNTVDYLIEAFSGNGPVAMGKETETAKRREKFSASFFMTFKKV